MEDHGCSDMDTRWSGTVFSSILGFFSKVVWALRLETSFFVGLVSRLLFSSIFESKFRRLGLLNLGFRMKSIAQTNFSQKVFFMDFVVFFVIC